MRQGVALLVAVFLALIGAEVAGQDGTPAASPVGRPTAAETVEIVLEPRPARGTTADAAALDLVRVTLERRLELLEIGGATVEVREHRIVVVVPAGAIETEALLLVLAEVGLLEIVDPQGAQLPEGTLVATTLGAPPEGPGDGPVYETIVDGNDLEDAFATTGSDGSTPGVGFRLREDAADALFAFTSANVGQPLAIVVDKRVVSTPVIQGATAENGLIGGLDAADVRGLVVQLGSGPLPVPLAVVSVDGAPYGATPVP